MRCGQCGRKLTDAALAMGYCPSCGNILPAGEPLPPLPTAQRFNQGALPAGAAGIATPLPLPPPRLSRPITLPPSADTPPATRYSHPVAAAGARPAAPSRPLAPSPVMPTPTPEAVVTQVRPLSNTALLVTLITLVALVLVVGGGLLVAGRGGVGPLAFLGTTTSHSTSVVAATPAATITATTAPTATPVPTVPPAPPGFVTFYSQDRAFGLNYDQSWSSSGPIPESSARGNSYNFTSPLQQFFQTTAVATTIVPNDITQFMQTFVTNSNGTGLQMTGDVTKSTNGANSWTTSQGTYVSGGQTWNIIGLAGNHKQHGYILIYTAPIAQYDTLPGSPFAEMVNSFTFL